MITDQETQRRILVQFKKSTGIDLNTFPITQPEKRDEMINRLYSLVEYHLSRGMTIEGATITTVDELAKEHAEIREIGPEAYAAKYHLDRDSNLLDV